MKRFAPLLFVLILLALFLAPIAVLSAGNAVENAATPSILAPDAGMGEAAFLSLLFLSMDPLAVIVAIALTQLVKVVMPSPVPGDRSTDTVTGSLYNRLLPIVPVLIGLSVVLLAHWGQPIRQRLVQGIVSGIAAAYFYRAGKVTIFGA